MASCLQAHAAPPEIAGGFNSDDSTDEPGSPVYSIPGGDADALVGYADNAQVLYTGPVATQFLTSKEGRPWDGTGRKWWYRNGLGTLVDFTRGPDVSWRIQPQEMDTRFIYQQVQLEVDKYGDHTLARLQYREGIITEDQLSTQLMKPRNIEDEAMICVYLLEQ